GHGRRHRIYELVPSGFGGLAYRIAIPPAVPELSALVVFRAAPGAYDCISMDSSVVLGSCADMDESGADLCIVDTKAARVRPGHVGGGDTGRRSLISVLRQRICAVRNASRLGFYSVFVRPHAAERSCALAALGQRTHRLFVRCG